MTLAIDEISLFNVRTKQSQTPWLTTVLTRSRPLYNAVLTNHSSYQIPNFVFNQCTFALFMLTGSAKAEKSYLEKWFTPLDDEF